MATSKESNSSQARTQVQAYVRKLLGSKRQAGGWGAASTSKLSLPKSTSTSRIAETPHSLPRQLGATAYSSTAKSESSGSSSVAGNAWLISPIATTVNSILSLFGGGSSSNQTTRYRTGSRETFEIVESISSQTGTRPQSINESAAGLTGVTSGVLATGSTSADSLPAKESTAASRGSGVTSSLENRQVLVAALRRSLSESRGIADVLNEFQDGL